MSGYNTFVNNFTNYSLGDNTYNKWENIDDAKLTITLTTPFKFNNINYQTLYLNSNGIINFTKPYDETPTISDLTKLVCFNLPNGDLYTIPSPQYIIWYKETSDGIFKVIYNSTVYDDTTKIYQVQVTFYLTNNVNNGTVEIDYGNISNFNTNPVYLGFSFGTNSVNNIITDCNLLNNNTFIYPYSPLQNIGNNESTFANKQLVIKPIPVPISNICFPAGTLISTDQGEISIEKVIPFENTINNKNIKAITKTISHDTYLVCFYKNALGKNYPNKKTMISKHHKILYKGKMIEAYKFLGHFERVQKMDYNQEILYNVLMEKYEKINVNNIMCETLHPNNIIAKLYNSNYGEDYKNKIICIMNESINKNDKNSYIKITKRINN